MTNLVLTILGDDRPGLVDELSGLIEAHDGNWEQSRLVRLADKFAGVVRVAVPPGRAAALERSLAMLAREQRLQILTEQQSGAAAQALRSLSLSLVGQDRPGIVHDISHALAARGVSIDELNSETESASMAGGLLFRAELELSVPQAMADEELRGVLEGLADEIMVDITLDEKQS